MKNLVVGASGQVGQALVRAFKIQNKPWVGTAHTRAQAEPGLRPLDLEDLEAAPALIRELGPSAVYFPAGWTWVDGCEADEEKAQRINALAPEAAARAARLAGAAFVYFSTEYVFDGKAGPYAEGDPPAPLGAYARSKLEGEKRVLLAHPGALVARTTVVYGPEPQGKNFVYQLVANLGQGKPMRVPGDQVSNPTYNDDLARACYELVMFGMAGTYHVVGRDRLDRLAFAREACRVFGLDRELLRPVSTADLGQKAARPLDAGLKADKLEAELGWRPRGARAGLEAMKAELDRAGGRS